jgi:hypothetical protein
VAEKTRKIIAAHPDTKYIPCKMFIKNIPAELTEDEVYFFYFFFEYKIMILLL